MKSRTPIVLYPSHHIFANRFEEYAEASSLWGHTKYADAVTLFKAAIELDPNFAMAHAALGRAYCSYIYYQMDLGRQEYEKALALAPRLTERETMIIEIHKAADLDQVEEAYGLYRAYLASYPEDWVMLRDYCQSVAAARTPSGGH